MREGRTERKNCSHRLNNTNISQLKYFVTWLSPGCTPRTAATALRSPDGLAVFKLWSFASHPTRDERMQTLAMGSKAKIELRSDYRRLNPLTHRRVMKGIRNLKERLFICQCQAFKIRTKKRRRRKRTWLSIFFSNFGGWKGIHSNDDPQFVLAACWFWTLKNTPPSKLPIMVKRMLGEVFSHLFLLLWHFTTSIKVRKKNVCLMRPDNWAVWHLTGSRTLTSICLHHLHLGTFILQINLLSVTVVCHVHHAWQPLILSVFWRRHAAVR